MKALTNIHAAVINSTTPIGLFDSFFLEALVHVSWGAALQVLHSNIPVKK